MNSILLLGAGFSRNWGGWLADETFEYLIGCPEIRRDRGLRELLWRHQTRGGGFESALEEVQTEFRRDPRLQGDTRLRAIQDAVTRMFHAMNGAFLEDTNLEFQPALERQVKGFLARFDAIFTLNQDLLLEHRYIDHHHHDISLTTNQRWNAVEIPGMRRVPSTDPHYANSLARSTWVPRPVNEYAITPRCQPYLKLHGSSNWRSEDGVTLLVMGGQKDRQIGLHAVLSANANAFDQYLSEPNTRLMVIGYGFRDAHINNAIARAIDRSGLGFFVIDPLGSKLAMSLNATRAPGKIQAPNELEGVFERGLIGASRRPLSDIFGDDTAEFNKVRRFLEPD